MEELFSILVASGKADPELLQFDAVRPVYFAVLHTVMLFGSNEVWLRLPSVIFGTANVFLVYRLASLVADRQTGLAAACITALSATEIYYSQQVRMYALGTCLTLLGSIAFVQSWQSGSRTFLYRFAGLRLLSMLTVPLSATTVAADAIIVWWNYRHHQLIKPFIGSLIVILLLWLPFAIQLPKLSTGAYGAWIRAVAQPTLCDAITALNNLTCDPYPLHSFKGPPVHDWSSVAYLLLFPLLLGLGVMASRKHAKLIWCALWVFIPLSMFYVRSITDVTVFLTRYLDFTAPALFILLAAGWSQVWQRVRPIGIIATAVYAVTMANSLQYYYQNPPNEDWKKISAVITANEKPGDQIVIWDPHSANLLKYYYRGSNSIHDMRVEPVNIDGSSYDIKITVDGLPDIHSRTWLINRFPPSGWRIQYEFIQRYRAFLQAHYRVLRHEVLPWTDIFLVEPQS